MAVVFSLLAVVERQRCAHPSFALLHTASDVIAELHVSAAARLLLLGLYVVMDLKLWLVGLLDSPMFQLFCYGQEG
uniref:Uncharacterized protein n=1 Tax=Anguilla anguilla TaxID=7936 RepID=A0A0E9X6D8_ANGAN